MNYDSMKKNTVNALKQLPESGMIRFYNQCGKGKRIMFIGNSITLHGEKPDIGWNFEHGMAASSKEKDYVHVLMNKINAVSKDDAFCICQASNWETTYKDSEATFGLYENARKFGADIIIFRIMENCPADNFDNEVFKREAKKFLNYLDASGSAQIVLTTPFWHHPGEVSIEQLAEEMNLPLVRLGDLGEKDEMKALGLFEHEGVANHPGDLGMQNIADRIFEKVRQYI